MPESVNIKVVTRCRPLTPEEVKKGSKTIVRISGDKTIVEAGKDHTFSADGAYPPETSNGQIYKERCEPLVQRAMEGYHSTIIAYGGTGAGKSYLMTGTDEDPGIIVHANRSIFEYISMKSGKDFMITVSFLEIVDEKMTDLLNPHNSSMSIRHHPQKGLFVEGLSEIVVKSDDHLAQMYEQGYRARKMGTSDMKAHRDRAHAIFTVVIEQRERQSSKVGLRSVLHMADVSGSDTGNVSDPDVIAGLHGLPNVLSALGGPKKGSNVPYRDSKLTRYLQDSLGGNSITLMFAVISPVDRAHQETLSTMQYAMFARNIKNKVKLNLDESNEVIAELREDISKLRDKIASSTEPNRDDVLKMEDLVKDLQIAKKQTWAEKEKASSRYESDRKVNLANRGVLEWVMDSVKKGNREMQQKVLLLQKDKDQLMTRYKEKRALVDQLKSDLQNKIADYSKYQEKGKISESENKTRVTSIQGVKERLKLETESLKTLKQQLTEIQDKQQLEKEGARAQITALKGNAELRHRVELEERQRMEANNRTMIAEELERAKLNADAEKVEIDARMKDGKSYSGKEGAQLEKQLAEMKSEKSVVTLQLQVFQQEKEKLRKELDEVHRVHKDEMELQQMEHYQTFRNYREMFEEQKAAIEQRYRKLLEDSIQDAVFLSTRNNELMQENNDLRKQMAEMKDVITKLGGRLPSSDMTA